MVTMTSLPVRRQGGGGGVVGCRMLVVVLLYQFLSPAAGCILLLDGWSPMSVGERATLADIVAVGVVLRVFKSDRSTDGAATYSAEVRIIDVFKGRPLVDSLPYKPEEQRSISDYTGNSLTSGATQLQHGNSSGAPH